MPEIVETIEYGGFEFEVEGTTYLAELGDHVWWAWTLESTHRPSMVIEKFQIKFGYWPGRILRYKDAPFGFYTYFCEVHQGAQEQLAFGVVDVATMPEVG